MTITPTPMPALPGCRKALLGLALLASASPAFAQANSAPPAGANGPTVLPSLPDARPPTLPRVQLQALPGGASGPPNVLQGIRWTEDWRRPAKADAPILERLKHIPLGDGQTYLTLGGEARVYYTDWHHSLVGLRPNDDNSATQSRLRLLADLHVGENVRAYVELGDNREFGAEIVTPPNRDKVDIYQAFVDVRVPLGDAGAITLRPGRFEMPLGNGKLVGLRDGLNMHFTYQGVEATYILPGALVVQGFAVDPVHIKPGTFDDGPDHTASFRGIYASLPNRFRDINFDAYWYRYDRDTALLLTTRGEDHRDNWGLRVSRRDPVVDVDLEANHQSGSFAGRNIDAFAVLFEGGYTFTNQAWRPRLGLRANLFSGDTNPGDGKAGTFFPAAPRLPVITEAAFFNFANLMDLYPSLTVKPSKTTLITLGPDFLWRYTRRDGIYVGPVGAGFAAYDSSKAIGTNLNIEANWQVSRYILLKVLDTYFSASDSFADHGGRSANYAGAQVVLKF